MTIDTGGETMKMTKKALKAVSGQAMARARTAGKGAAQRLAIAADAALVEAGQAAKRRQHSRAVKAALKVVGKAVVIAGTAAATVMAARALRAARARKTAS